MAFPNQNMSPPSTFSGKPAQDTPPKKKKKTQMSPSMQGLQQAMGGKAAC